jgi:hypothetical protein
LLKVGKVAKRRIAKAKKMMHKAHKLESHVAAQAKGVLRRKQKALKVMNRAEEVKKEADVEETAASKQLGAHEGKVDLAVSEGGILGKEITAAKAAATRVAKTRATMERAAKKWISISTNSTSQKDHTALEAARKAEHAARVSFKNSKRRAARLKRILRQALNKTQKSGGAGSGVASPSLLATKAPDKISQPGLEAVRALVDHGMHRMMVSEPVGTHSKEAPLESQIEQLRIARAQMREHRLDAKHKMKSLGARIKRATRRRERQLAEAKKLSGMAHRMEKQARVAARSLKHLNRSKGGAAKKVANGIRKDELKLKASATRLRQKAAQHTARAKVQSRRVKDTVASMKKHKLSMKKMTSQAKEQEEKYHMLSEAYGGVVVVGTPSIPHTKKGATQKAGKILNRLAEVEQRAAAHEKAAADARALEGKEQSRAAAMLKRAHELSEYLRNKYPST